MGQEDAAQLDRIGGELCLDFANTVGNHKGESPNEHLDNYVDLVVWSRHAGILSPQLEKALLRQAARRPEQARQVYKNAISLREVLYRIFTAASAQLAPNSADMELFNTELASALSHSRLRAHGGNFALGWEMREDEMDQMLWPVVRSAADLLTSDRIQRVRECEGDTCGWLFIDVSKNHTRRWCSMGDCGNRAKARRFYQRRRTGTAA